MPMLLEDLVLETSASNRRTADRLEEEARGLEELRRAEGVLEEIQQRAIESARQATDYVVSRMVQADEVWRLALIALRKQKNGEDAERLLRALLTVFESGQRLIRSPHALWKLAEQVGAAPEGLDALERA